MSVHFNETHFACKEQVCLNKAFVVFRSEAELLNHYEHEHTSSKSSNSRRKNKGKAITNIGEAKEIVIKDDQGEDISTKLLSHIKSKEIGEHQGTKELIYKMDILEMFQMLFNIKGFESKLIRQKFEEILDEDFDFEDDKFWFYKDELYDQVKKELKGNKINMTDEIREYIKDTQLEKARIKKQNRNKNKDKNDDEGDEDLVYKKNSEKAPRKEAKKELDEIEKRDRQLKIEDIIFKRWATGHEIDWETFEEKSGYVVNYKGREDTDFYTYEFINDKITSEQLLDAFVQIFTFKYSFRYFYLFLLTVRKPRRRKALTDTLYKRLLKTQFRHKNILIGKRNFKVLFAEMTQKLKDNILSRYKRNSIRKFEGIHSDKLYQFFKSIKTLRSKEVTRLKFLGMYLSDEMALHKIQKAFWIDQKKLNKWFDTMNTIDVLISYLYFYMIGLKYSNQPIFIKLKSNPNLIKVFFRINLKECDDFEFDIDSEEEDYELYKKEQDRKRKLEAERDKRRSEMEQARQRKMSMQSRDNAKQKKGNRKKENGFEKGGKVGGQWGREDPAFSFGNQSKKDQKTVNLRGIPKKVKNIFERDEQVVEEELNNNFDFPTLEGGKKQPRGKFTYTNAKLEKKNEANPEQFPTLGGNQEVFNPVYKGSKKKKQPQKFNKPKSNAYRPPEDYPSLGNASEPSGNVIIKKQKKKKKKNKNNNQQNWSDLTPSIMGGTKRQKKKQIEQDFPTLGDENNEPIEDYLQKAKKSKIRPNRMNMLEQKYGNMDSNEPNYLDRTGHEAKINNDFAITVGTKKKKKRRRKK
jgi:hypothetical protein